MRGARGSDGSSVRGAASEGGLNVGILPTNRANDANPWVKVRIPTGLGSARNPLVVRSGTAVIAVDGSYGTLTEIAFTLAENTPVVALNSWENALGEQWNEDGIHWVDTPIEAAVLAVELAFAHTASL